jgi:predicted phosphodiesterase
MFDGAEADLIFVGHIHVPQDRQLDDLRVVNVASVSNPMRDDPRPHYVLLEADANGYQIESRYVDVDFAAIIDAIKAARHPSEDYLLDFWTK